MEWKHFKTAPKDGRKILVVPWFGLDDAFVTWWIKDDERWANCHWEKLEWWVEINEPPEK